MVSFFTSGTTFLAVDYGKWKAQVEGRSGGLRCLRRGPGTKPRWVDDVDGSVALLINTCDNLERLFIDYIAEQTKLPVWGVGLLLPENYWNSVGSLLHDSEMSVFKFNK
ncbi:hypothetical protein Tco_0373819 [Tanacetum coccineum]